MDSLVSASQIIRLSSWNIKPCFSSNVFGLSAATDLSVTDYVCGSSIPAIRSSIMTSGQQGWIMFL